MMKFIILCFVSISFVYSLQIPLTNKQKNEVERVLSLDTKDYSSYGFSEEEKKQYFELDVFISSTKESDNIPEEYFDKWDTLHEKYKKVKQSRAKDRVLIRTIKKSPEKIKLIKKIIDKGVNVNYKDDKGNPPIYYAMQKDNDEIVDILIKAGADINYINKDGLPFIVITAYYNSPKTMKLLIDAGVDVNYKGKSKKTAIQIVFETSNNYMSVKSLLDAGATFDPEFFSAAQSYITRTDSVKNTSKLVDELSSILGGNKNTNSNLITKSENRGDPLKVVDLLLKRGFKPKCKTIRYTESEQTLRLYKNYGININCLYKDNPLIFSFVPDLSLTDDTFNHIKWILNLGVSPDIKNKNGKTFRELIKKFLDNDRGFNNPRHKKDSYFDNYRELEKLIM